MDVSASFSLTKANSNFFLKISSHFSNKQQITLSRIPFSKSKPKRRKNTLKEKLKLISLPTQHQIIKKSQENITETETEIEPESSYHREYRQKSELSVSYNHTQENYTPETKTAPFVINGFLVVCAICAVGVLRKLFVTKGKEKVELSREEVEMLRRKKKARMEKTELYEKGSVEVVENVAVVDVGRRPKLDKDELVKYIKDVEKSLDSFREGKDGEFESKVREIREMAREARELERKERAEIDEMDASEDMFGLSNEASRLVESNGNGVKNEQAEQNENAVTVGLLEKETLSEIIDSIGEMEREARELEWEELVQNDERDARNFDGRETDVFGSSKEIGANGIKNEEVETVSVNLVEKESSSNIVNSVKNVPTIIKSVKEAKEYLSEKHGNKTARQQSGQVVDQCKLSTESHDDIDPVSLLKGLLSNGSTRTNFRDVSARKTVKSKLKFNENNALEKNNQDSDIPIGTSETSSTVSVNAHILVSEEHGSENYGALPKSNEFNYVPKIGQTQVRTFQDGVDIEEGHLRSEKRIEIDSERPNGSDTDNESWVEENFEKFDPIINKIHSGFKENYMLAKERVNESAISAEIAELGLMGEDEELEWMKDEKLREIVFQVRDNELAGRDPFHLMDMADQRAFFEGLELKAEKVNEKLSGLHEWVHSRIENLDYGTDGISMDDPLEKMVPRWKGPTIDKDLQFHNKNTDQNPIQKPLNLNNKSSNGASTSGNTFIECSDGTQRPGKKTGKEHWEHTKKWSQGFLEVYNSVTDPEIKSIMKDMGKSLDRWITEKETKDVADLMTKIPKRQRRYIQKKMDKLKRELDMYGPQAVVSKYREYSDEKQEDYLWWLDLQYVLCIELYTVEDGVQKIGFYSIEMAADLELNPKQYHVIAFDDPADSKNFCYIVQAHMEMLGSGSAFVVARPPKDTFREAKANGFNVTVIKKGEIKLNIDQTLEEVEEKLTEIGSKIYHDKIMSERGVDIRTLTKGVISADKATRRKPKGMLMRTDNS